MAAQFEISDNYSKFPSPTRLSTSNKTYILESMRLYPPAGSLFRECTKDYVFEDLGVKIEKGTGVLIPVGGLQRNPDYFPNPDIFQPERFLPEEKAKREQFAYLPFGEGPRICIGKKTNFYRIQMLI